MPDMFAKSADCPHRWVLVVTRLDPEAPDVTMPLFRDVGSSRFEALTETQQYLARLEGDGFVVFSAPAPDSYFVEKNLDGERIQIMVELEAGRSFDDLGGFRLQINEGIGEVDDDE